LVQLDQKKIPALLIIFDKDMIMILSK